jgi:hypothetical protein
MFINELDKIAAGIEVSRHPKARTEISDYHRNDRLWKEFENPVKFSRNNAASLNRHGRLWWEKNRKQDKPK